MNYWLVLGVGILAVLLCIAIYYRWLIYKHNNYDAERTAVFKQELDKRRGRSIESIVLLCRAVIDEQVSLTEASIRINALSQILLIDDNLSDSFSVFRQLSETTAHIPILERWKVLPKHEKQKYDQERAVIEEKFKEFVMVSARSIVMDGVYSSVKMTPSSH
ncbi:MAG: hypothetical protein ACI9Y1_000969 [Lentisphaeria bacterium]|jgi:hypothetical protein